ncbi:hypothetical protein IMY05_013G0053700 [Salix suchowensis]|nr:hypothetical protein IMY05_013G0053700 [Salix suchowensis]
MIDSAKCSNKQTLGFIQGYFEIIVPIGRYTIRVFSPFQRFMIKFLSLQLRKQQLGTLTKAGPKKFKDIFSQVVLGCSPFDFS